MKTSSNVNIFRVTGPLWGETTGHESIPTKAIDAELWCFLWYAPEQTAKQTIETPVITYRCEAMDVQFMFGHNMGFVLYEIYNIATAFSVFVLRACGISQSGTTHKNSLRNHKSKLLSTKLPSKYDPLSSTPTNSSKLQQKWPFATLKSN